MYLKWSIIQKLNGMIHSLNPRCVTVPEHNETQRCVVMFQCSNVTCCTESQSKTIKHA